MKSASSVMINVHLHSCIFTLEQIFKSKSTYNLHIATNSRVAFDMTLISVSRIQRMNLIQMRLTEYVPIFLGIRRTMGFAPTDDCTYDLHLQR